MCSRGLLGLGPQGDEGGARDDGPCDHGINLNDCHTFFFFFGWRFPTSGSLPPSKVGPPSDPGGTVPDSQQEDHNRVRLWAGRG